jgi:probable phosphoglycerate mutase
LRVTLNIDGGARGNPGPAGAAFVIRAADDGAVLRQRGIFLGRQTNNVAEYRALLAGLEAAAELGASQVEVVSDSELLVRQMNGRYRVRNEDLKKLFDEALALQGKFSACTYRHVRREQNAPADRLVNQAINLKRNVTGDDG